MLDFGLQLPQDDLNIEVSIKENVIVDIKKESHRYEGALINAFIRFHLQKQKKDFCFEIEMSHSSIIEAKTNGFKTYPCFVCIDDPELNISRVENWVCKGGHAVSPDKIENRYNKTLENLISAIEITHKCHLFDNSGGQFELIAKTENGQLFILSPDLPNWFINYVLKYYK